MIASETIQRIKDSANVVDVIGDFYDLKKRGTVHECLCPFHQDRHIGSFMVSEAKNCYTCFSCGAHGNSVDFLMEHEGLKMPEAIAWLGKKYGIEVEGSERYKVRPAKPREKTPPLPILTLEYDKFVAPRLNFKDNILYKWIRTLNWDKAQEERIDKVFKDYQVGTSIPDGRVIWWQIDDEGSVRTGKLMPYKSDGHRDKEGRTNWIHSLLFKANIYDYGSWDVQTTLFGMHLLRFVNPKQVKIVESEKTAIICTIAYGNMQRELWLATGGKTNLNRDKLKPIIDRGIPIVLYPDHDAIEEWEEQAKKIGYNNLHVDKRFMRQYWREEDGEKADIADILIRSVTPQLDKIFDKYPILKEFSDKVGGLEFVSITNP